MNQAITNRLDEKSLFELSQSPQAPVRTREKVSAIRLSHMGWKVEKIATYMKWTKKQ
ncbi:MAG: hypothetical protein F6K09_39060 [Merismopedia sp. SIO2A8]|nr:hypothetical protein [Symploca sp. SIO2B6]NET54385.1 hypothetical protein [Merismopedia sp. SIO2A8]